MPSKTPQTKNDEQSKEERLQIAEEEVKKQLPPAVTPQPPLLHSFATPATISDAPTVLPQRGKMMKPRVKATMTNGLNALKSLMTSLTDLIAILMTTPQDTVESL